REPGKHSHDSRCYADVDAVRDDRLLRFTTALRVQDFEDEAMLLEDPCPLSHLRDRRIPVAALACSELERVFGAGGKRSCERHCSNDDAEMPEHAHRILQRIFQYCTVAGLTG